MKKRLHKSNTKENVSIKNYWSLNVDEIVVATQLKTIFKKKDYEVFFPLNAQSEGIDLILFNKKTRNAVTIQVKGSKPYGPPDFEVNQHGSEGNSAWFSKVIPTKTAKRINLKNIDFFILVASYCESECKKEGDSRKSKQDYLIIPTNKVKNITQEAHSKLKWSKTDLHLLFYEKNKKRKVEVQCRKKKKSKIDLSKYLGENGWNLIKKEINN